MRGKSSVIGPKLRRHGPVHQLTLPFSRVCSLLPHITVTVRTHSCAFTCNCQLRRFNLEVSDRHASRPFTYRFKYPSVIFPLRYHLSYQLAQRPCRFRKRAKCIICPYKVLLYHRRGPSHIVGILLPSSFEIPKQIHRTRPYAFVDGF